MSNTPLYSFAPNFFIKKIIVLYAFINIVGAFLSIKNNFFEGLIMLAVWSGCVCAYFIVELFYFRLHIYDDRIEYKTLWGKQKNIYYADIQNISIEVLLDFHPFNTPEIYINGIDSDIMFRPSWFENKAEGTAAANLILAKCKHLQPKEGLTREQRNYFLIPLLLRFGIVSITLIAVCMLFLS